MSTKKINGVYITTPKQQSDPGGGVPEAPKDGHVYGRKDGDWEKVQGSGESHPYLSLERLRRYLYRVTFDQLSEDNGGDNAISGGCSSYVNAGKLYRNLDFKYDNAASFIVRTRDFEGMSFITGLNDGDLDDELIAQLPYRIVDGRNNNGIMVSTHVLFNDWNWSGTGERNISLTRLPFLVLSRVKSMATIAADLAGVLGNLYASEGLQATGYLLQVLVSDGTTTYAILPPTSAGQSYVLQDITANPKLANFRWVLAAQVDREDMDLQTRPTGIERFNAMPCALADLRFTKAYESSDRLSEFIGIDGTTKTSSDAELLAIYQRARAEYLDRQRDGETWQTMHSVVYGDKMEELYIQENWNDNCIPMVIYRAGEGIGIEGGVIGVDFNVVASNMRVNEVATELAGLEQNVGENTTAIAELQAEIEGVIGAQTNFVGIVASTSALPTVTEPSWGLVGTDIDALNAYVWNGTAWSQFGTKTYDFTDFSEVKEKLSEMGLREVSESGWFITDGSSNIGMKYDDYGLDFAAISLHAIQVIKQAMTGDIVNVKEHGLFLVDSEMRVGAKIDSTGLHAINMIEYNIVNN